jgi:hypothetical protein
MSSRFSAAATPRERAKVDDWTFSSPEWLSRVLPHHLKRARVLAFDYSISFNERELSVKQFLDQGVVLLNALAGARPAPSAETQTRPLLVICHSLGGLVPKHALWIAKQQSHRYGCILGAVAGIVFLGTPHRGLSEADTLKRWLTIVASTTNLRKSISLPKDRVPMESTLLAQLADRFEYIADRWPILTITESKKTKVYLGMLKRESLLVSGNRESWTYHVFF